MRKNASEYTGLVNGETPQGLLAWIKDKLHHTPIEIDAKEVLAAIKGQLDKEKRVKITYQILCQILNCATLYSIKPYGVYAKEDYDTLYGGDNEFNYWLALFSNPGLNALFLLYFLYRAEIGVFNAVQNYRIRHQLKVHGNLLIDVLQTVADIAGACTGGFMFFLISLVTKDWGVSIFSLIANTGTTYIASRYLHRLGTYCLQNIFRSLSGGNTVHYGSEQITVGEVEEILKAAQDSLLHTENSATKSLTTPRGLHALLYQNKTRSNSKTVNYALLQQLKLALQTREFFGISAYFILFNTGMTFLSFGAYWQDFLDIDTEGMPDSLAEFTETNVCKVMTTAAVIYDYILATIIGFDEAKIVAKSTITILDTILGLLYKNITWEQATAGLCEWKNKTNASQKIIDSIQIVLGYTVIPLLAYGSTVTSLALLRSGKKYYIWYLKLAVILSIGVFNRSGANNILKAVCKKLLLALSSFADDAFPSSNLSDDGLKDYAADRLRFIFKVCCEMAYPQTDKGQAAALLSKTQQFFTSLPCDTKVNLDSSSQSKSVRNARPTAAFPMPPTYGSIQSATKGSNGLESSFH